MLEKRSRVAYCLPMSQAATPQKVIARGVGSNAASFVLRFAARASLLYIGARLYGPASYGVFVMAVAVVELAVPVASLGLKRMVFPWLEDEAEQRQPTHILLDALLLVICAGTLVAAFVMLAAALAPPALVSNNLRLALMLAAPAVLGQIISDVALAATRWTHKMRYEVIARGFIEPYVATAIAFLAWFHGWSGTGLLMGYWGGTIALTLFSLHGARHCLGRFDLGHWRPDLPALAARARHLLPATGSDLVSGLAQRIDLYLVGLLLGDAPVGIYSVVREFRTPILQIRQAFDGILTPLIARTMRTAGDITTGEATAAATRVILTAQLAVILFMVAAGQALLGLLGHQYVAGYAALIVLVLGEAVNGAFGVSELILYYRRPTLAWANNVLLIAIAAILIPVLTPLLSSAGAALAMLTAAILAARVRRHWLKRLGIKRAALHALPPVLAALLAGAAGLGLSALLPPDGGIASPIFHAVLPPVVALALYAWSIRTWSRMRPDALSLVRFRI